MSPLHRPPLAHHLFIVCLVIVLAISPTLATAAPIPASRSVAETTTLTATTTTVSTLNNNPLQPDALAAPLSLTRSQSTYDAATAGGELTVTLTVHNNLPPLESPALIPTANVTDTVAALTSFDYGRDPNRIRQVVVSDTLLTGVTLLDADPQPSRNGSELVWNLGDIGPYDTAEITLRLAVPASAGTATDLDSGAQVFGQHQGRLAQAAATPARLAPDGFAAFLTCTIDANCADPYVIQQAGELGNDGPAAFAFVRDEVGFEAYDGSLRGARGTLWSAAGNSIDQASLLTALLRASGIPARYLHGTLSTAHAQTLITSMFPPSSGTGGVAPADEPLADPANSSALLDPTRDHWWVEAYLPGQGWTQLDPSFAGANSGQTFATPIGGGLVELPDSLRHKVTVTLKVEQYNPFSVTPGGVGLSTIQPLSQTFNTVELVGEPVTLGHLVSTNTSGGLVFTNYEHTYIPYLVVGLEETLYQGTPYLELLTNFPLASNPVLAQWLIFTLTAPDGHTQTYERDLFDYVGYDVRQGIGALGLDIERSSEPVLRETSQYTTLFAPSGVSLDAISRTYPAMVAAIQEGQAALEATDAVLAAGTPGPEDWDTLSAARLTFGRVARLAQRISLLRYTTVADFTTQAYGEAFQVKAYPNAPRIYTIAWEEDVTTGAGTLSMDLRRDELNVVPYPGQTLDGLRSFNTARSLYAMSLESQILDEIGVEPVLSVAAILQAADDQGIELGIYTVTQLDQLDALPISSLAKARITTALTDNPRLAATVPTAMVQLNGEPAIGWLLMDIVTGQIIDVQENGQHMVAVEYATLLNSSIQEIGFAMAGFAHGFAAYTFAWLGGFFGAIAADPTNVAAAKASAAATAEQITNSIQQAVEDHCCGGNDEWRDAYLGGVTLLNISLNFGDIYTYEVVDIKVGGFSNGVAAAQSIISASDPPLPVMRFSRYAPHFGQEVVRATRNAAATVSGTGISATLSAASASLLGGLSGNWSAGGDHAFSFNTLSATNGTVSAPGGPPLGSGVINASAVMSNALGLGSSAQPLTTQVNGDGGIGLYAAAANGLAGGAQWTDYTAQLNSAQPYSLRLWDALVLAGSATFSGTLDVALAVPADVNGAGRGVAPAFPASAAFTLSQGGVMVGPATGSLAVGGNPVSAANGFALAAFDGSAAATDSGGSSDTLTLSGNGAFFALSLSPASATIAPVGSTSFASTITANASDAYTMTVFAPTGWTATLDTAGGVTATPPPGAAPGAYQLLVTAQSHAHPDLFVSAIHTVTTTAYQNVTIDVAADPRWTVPWGIALRDDGLGGTNTGQVQLPDAAFTIDVINPSTTSHDFTVTITGLPAGWTILDGQEGANTTTITLPAGGSGRVGLAVRPVGSLTPVGATYPFVATVTDNDGAGLNAGDNDVFTMPAIAFNYLTAQPTALYGAANGSVDFDVLLQNVGNTAASYALSAEMPAGDWSLSGLSSPVTLAAGETDRQPLTLNLGAGNLGDTFTVRLASPATGTIYTQRLLVPVRIVGPGVNAGFDGAGEAAACDANGSTAAAMQTLATALANLEGSCMDGECDLLRRDAAVEAAQSVTDYAALYFPLADTATLSAAAAALAGHSSAVDITADITALGDALAQLGLAVCELSQHLPTLRWRPNFNAGLPGLPVSYTLELHNQGTADTTYLITTTLPSGEGTLSPTVAAGDTYTTTINASAAAVGQYTLLAEATASGAGVELPGITVTATGWLNVVERFVQLTAVTPDPAFVETGVSSTTVRIDVVNVANIPQDATAQLRILADDASLSYSADLPLLIAAGAPHSYELVTVDTSGWNSGLYTVTVDLVDAATHAPIADGSGYGYLGVGEALEVAHSLSPLVGAPGDITVTTVITTAVLLDTILNRGAQPAQPLWSPRGLDAGKSVVVTRQAGAETVGLADQSGVSVGVSGSLELVGGDALTPALSQGERGGVRPPQRQHQGGFAPGGAQAGGQRIGLKTLQQDDGVDLGAHGGGE